MKILSLVMCLAIIVLALGSLMAQQAKVLDGKQIFLAQKCDSCHMVSSAGIESKSKTMKADLTGRLADRDATAIADMLRKKGNMKSGKPHLKAFTGTDEELGALIAWLQKQTKKPS